MEETYHKVLFKVQTNWRPHCLQERNLCIIDSAGPHGRKKGGQLENKCK
jgi:hypothetical protein